ncbi:MAG TPA: SusD/RagB family nutrient-binding outer membrane lipoprotein [Longimicrobium sp.]|nr:SusD/RagB family nutrient-binding outer membrane lipoprotein [Longimicrobium sp.]
MKLRNWKGRALGAALLVGSLGGCNFIDITDADPNIITQPTLPSLFVSTQVNSFTFAEGNLARIAAVWTQQLAGADRQFALLDRYDINEEDADGEFAAIYTGGGLVDIRRARTIADSVGCPQCSSLFAIHEAYLIGMGASIFGDLPYRGALVEGVPAKLDPQAQVYADVQILLDGAIAGLASAPTGGGVAFYTSMTAVDLVFGGSRPNWTAAAQSLKARYYLHWVEAQRSGVPAAVAAAQTACAGDCLAKASTAARAGISTAAGDWRAFHSTASTESNLFFQFFSDRAGYIVAGNNLVQLLVSRADPRLPRYFAPVGGSGTTFRGSRAGEANQSASILATTAGVGAGARDYRQPLLTCAETQFILAEISTYQGATGTAQSALKAGIDCAEARAGVTITNPSDASIDALTGTALFTEIMTQKYIANFLNMEVYNDYKRTCLPRLTTYNNLPIPGRLFYGQQERQSNPEIPVPDNQPKYNTNDPLRC